MLEVEQTGAAVINPLTQIAYLIQRGDMAECTTECCQNGTAASNGII